ncbi:MAG: glycosyl hydrolase family 65 protein [Angelakisella sp.]
MLYNDGTGADTNWVVAEEQFDQRRTGKCESILCQGNGYLGIRAATEEDYLTNQRNTFIAGTFNQFGDEVTELPNVADVIAMPLAINGDLLDLSRGQTQHYLRKLNLKNGLLTRSFVWVSPNGAAAEFTFRRMVSQKNKHLVLSQLTVKPLHQAVTVTLQSGINGQVSNSGTQHFIEGEKRCYDKKYMQSVAVTSQSGIAFVSNSTHNILLDGKMCLSQPPVTIARRKIYMEYTFSLPQGSVLEITKISNHYTTRDLECQGLSVEALQASSLAALKAEAQFSFDQHLADSAEVWEATVWAHKDISLDTPNDFDQLALRFAIYHLTGMAPIHDNRMNIGAKGLSGEGYKGHTFWDTELFMLPVFILSDAAAARSLIEYRYHGLGGARRKALENGYEGAMYPWESAWIEDGEVTPLWGAGDVVTGKTSKIWTGILEQHISSDVAYGAYYYYTVTGDDEFMERCGYEMILDTAKFWQSRLEWNGEKGRYEINNVIGPDEYKEHINNNAFTNYMAHWNIQLAMDYTKLLKKEQPALYDRLNQALDLDTVYPKWVEKVDKIYLPQWNEQLIVPQDDTYLTLPQIDLTKYKASQIVGAIDGEYNMEQIGQLQVSKQADLLVLFYLMEDLFPQPVKSANFHFYEARCLHDSSLSLSTHSILASDLQEKELAYQLFTRACRIDLGPVMTTSDEGIHAASFGGIWQCAINGFAGVRVVGGQLRIQPNLPQAWNRVTFHLNWQGQTLRVTVTKEQLTVENLTKTKAISFLTNHQAHSLTDVLTLSYQS